MAKEKKSNLPMTPESNDSDKPAIKETKDSQPKKLPQRPRMNEDRGTKRGM